MDSADKLAAERHASLLDKIETVRSGVSIQVKLAMANRRIQELQARQQGSRPQQAPLGQ